MFIFSILKKMILKDSRQEWILGSIQRIKFGIHDIRNKKIICRRTTCNKKKKNNINKGERYSYKKKQLKVIISQVFLFLIFTNYATSNKWWLIFCWVLLLFISFRNRLIDLILITNELVDVPGQMHVK